MVWETLVRVLTSVGKWKTSLLVMDWLLYGDKAPTGTHTEKYMSVLDVWQ